MPAANGHGAVYAEFWVNGIVLCGTEYAICDLRFSLRTGADVGICGSAKNNDYHQNVLQFPNRIVLNSLVFEFHARIVLDRT